MPPPPDSPPTDPAAEAAAWDKVRTAFASSALADTPLAVLARELDVPPWPREDADETPSAYVSYDRDEVLLALGSRGHPPTRLPHLISILAETLAFDDPFADMMEPAAPTPGAPDSGSPLLKNLTRLGISADFPLRFTTLQPGTLELCRLEGVETLGHFVEFATRLAQTVIVGGDFRALLNAVAQRDEAALAACLPYRPLQGGLHLREALLLEAARLPAPLRTALAANPASAPAELSAHIGALLAWFADDLATWTRDLTAGTPPAAYFAGVPDPALSAAALALASPRLPRPIPPPSPTPAAKPRPFWRRWLGLS